MKHSQLRPLVTEVIAYSRLVTKKLDSGECISLHQWANLNVEPSIQLRNKFNLIVAEIMAKKWIRPMQKYDDNLYLYYFCEKTKKWINTNIN